MNITITKEGLATMTLEQRDALLRIANERVADVDVMKGGLDLPNGYLTFWQHYPTGAPIYGGIAPDGDVST